MTKVKGVPVNSTAASTLLVNRIIRNTILTAEEERALAALPDGDFTVSDHHEVVLQDETGDFCCMLAGGLLARIVDTASGARQITGFYVPGEMPDIHTLIMPGSAPQLQAIGGARIVRIPRPAAREALRRFPVLAEAFWRETIIDTMITAQWIANIGQRQARPRIAHLFVEIALRLGSVRGNVFDYAFPPTQTQLGQATGMSVVHVNRSLQALQKAGVLTVRQGHAFVHDWARLKSIAEFDEGYLAFARPRRFMI